MSAIATGDGAYVAERVGQLTMPPTITTIRNTSDVVPISAARIPCRAGGTLAAIEPVVMPTDYISESTVIQRIHVAAELRCCRRRSSVLTEKTPIEQPRLALRFEAELRVELLGEPLIARDNRFPKAEGRLGVHGQPVS